MAVTMTMTISMVVVFLFVIFFLVVFSWAVKDAPRPKSIDACEEGDD